MKAFANGCTPTAYGMTPGRDVTVIPGAPSCAPDKNHAIVLMTRLG
jgi:hypothetical protein